MQVEFVIIVALLLSHVVFNLIKKFGMNIPEHISEIIESLFNFSEGAALILFSLKQLNF